MALPQVLCTVLALQCKDIKLLESGQRRATMMVKGLKEKTYKEWLRSLVLSREQKTEGRPHGSLQLPHMENRRAGTDLFSLVTTSRN